MSGGPVQIERSIAVSTISTRSTPTKGRFRRRIEYCRLAENGGATDPLCPGGQTATPVIGPPNASGARIIGALRKWRVALPSTWRWRRPGVAGSPLVPHQKSPDSCPVNNIAIPHRRGCAMNPNQMWAINSAHPQKKVMTFNPKSGGLWGRTGAADRFQAGTAWAPTRRRRVRPGQPKVLGNWA